MNILNEDGPIRPRRLLRSQHKIVKFYCQTLKSVLETYNLVIFLRSALWVVCVRK